MKELYPPKRYLDHNKFLHPCIVCYVTSELLISLFSQPFRAFFVSVDNLEAYQDFFTG